jgi:hypothetical protein
LVVIRLKFSKGDEKPGFLDSDNKKAFYPLFFS